MFILQLFTARHDRVTAHPKENGAAVSDKLAKGIWRQYKATLSMGKGLGRDNEDVGIWAKYLIRLSAFYFLKLKLAWSGDGKLIYGNV